MFVMLDLLSVWIWHLYTQHTVQWQTEWGGDVKCCNFASFLILSTEPIKNVISKYLHSRRSRRTHENRQNRDDDRIITLEDQLRAVKAQAEEAEKKFEEVVFSSYNIKSV